MSVYSDQSDTAAEISDRLHDRASDWARTVRQMNALDHLDAATDGPFTRLAGERRRLADSLGEWIVIALANGYGLDEIAELTDLDEDTLTRFPGVTDELAA